MLGRKKYLLPWVAILQGLDDTSAGKLVSYICEFEFADTKPEDSEMTDKENFYWSNLSDMLEEVKETECAGKKPKKYNLQSLSLIHI